MQDIRSEAATGLLSRASDETTFLTELAVAYSLCGIGSALDFDAVRRYFCDGELAADWRRELAQQTRYSGADETWRGREPMSTLLRGLLGHLPVAEWIVRGERCALLLAPLLEPVYLCSLLAPRSEDGGPRVRQDELQSVQAAALAAWADALIAGSGGWAAVSAALRDEAFDTDVLRRAFADTPVEHWAGNDDETRATLRVLAQLRFALLLAREHVFANGAIDPDWALTLLMETQRNTYLSLGRPIHALDGLDGLLAGLLRPLARAAARSPRLSEFAARTQSPLGDMVSSTGLVHLLAEDDAHWARFLDALSDQQLRRFWPWSSFRARFPAAALRYEQAKWRRCAQFRCEVETPEARAWYASLLDELTNDSDFGAAFERVCAGADVETQRTLIAKHLLQSARPAYYELLEPETDAARLLDYARSPNTSLRDRALSRLFDLAVPTRDDDEASPAPAASGGQVEPYWSALRSLEATMADALVDRTVDEYSFHRDGAERWDALWQQARQPASRSAIAKCCLRAISSDSLRAEARTLAETLYARDPAIFVGEVSDSYFDVATFNTAITATASPLRELVAVASAAHLSQSSWFGGGNSPLPAAPISAALAAFPQSFAALDEKRQSKLLPLLDTDAVIACAPTLALLCATSSKVVRPLLLELVARTALDTLRASGLLDIADRKSRQLVLTGLAQNADPAAIDAIAATIGDKAHDDLSRGLALDALARAGRAIDALDPWHGATLESLQTLAAKAKIPAAVAKSWNDEAARLLAPLGADLGRYLFAILLDADDLLPRRARQILAFLPAALRSDFAGYGVRTWIAEKGADKFNWLLSPLFEYGDERVANDLVRAVKAWMKTRKPKASAAIHLLSRLPGTYGIAQVKELWESRKFSESIQRNARLALEDAARRQGMSLAEFLEQLVPDFGLERDGLRLNVGPYAYTARVRGDFSVVVVDVDGKATKTLPRARAGEDAELRGLADNQLKALAKNLKPVFKQQSQRLLRNLQTGKIWPVALWRRLYTEHPLLAVLSQSVVWSSVGEHDVSLLRFRPNGSGGVVDAHDDDVALADDAVVRVAHPLEIPAEELRAWEAQFGDYELISPLAQFDIRVFTAEAGELDDLDVKRASGSTLNRAKFGSLVEKWGYLKGAGEDGAMINEHTWRPDGDWHVTLLHSGISVFFTVDEDVTVERFLPRRRGIDGRFEPVPLRALPPAFRATLLAQAEALKAAGG